MPSPHVTKRPALADAERDRAAAWLKSPNRKGEPNDNLAHWCVSKFTDVGPSDSDYEDVLQVARWAIVWALTAPTFDPRRVALSTYVTTAARNAVVRWADLRDRHGFAGAVGGADRPAWLDDPDVIEGRAESVSPSPALWRRAFLLLPSREFWVIHARYKLGKTLRDVADELGVCKERIRQLEVSALNRLRLAFADEA